MCSVMDTKWSFSSGSSLSGTDPGQVSRAPSLSARPANKDRLRLDTNANNPSINSHIRSNTCSTVMRRTVTVDRMTGVAC